MVPVQQEIQDNIFEPQTLCCHVPSTSSQLLVCGHPAVSTCADVFVFVSAKRGETGSSCLLAAKAACGAGQVKNDVSESLLVLLVLIGFARRACCIVVLI